MKKFYNFRLVLALLTITFAPAWLTTRFVSNYQLELSQAAHENDLSRARIKLAELQTEMSEEFVVNKFLTDFKALTENLLNGQPLENQDIPQLLELFSQRTTEHAIAVWLTPELIILPDSHPADGRRAWQSFIRSIISPETTSNTETRIAESFVRANISELLSTDFLSDLANRFKPILFRGERHYLGWSSFKNHATNQTLGYGVFMLPAVNIQAYWSETRALRLANKGNVKAGGMIVSQNKLLDNSAINFEKLVQFNQLYQRGINQVRQGGFYYWDTHFDNPDLFVAVKIEEFPASLPTSVKVISLAIWIPFAASIVLAMLMTYGYAPGLTLREKFEISTFLLAAIPLIMVFILGLIQTSRVRLESRRERNQKLEAMVSDIEESVARKSMDFYIYLTNELPLLLSQQQRGHKIADTAFEALKNYGCEAATLFCPDGASCFRTGIDELLARKRISYLLTTFETRMIDDNFNTEKFRENFPRPSILDDKIVERRGDFGHDTFDRINRIDLGAISLFSYCTYLYANNNELIGSLMLGFDARQLQNYLLKTVFSDRQRADSRVFIASNHSTSVQILPANNTLDRLLSIAAATDNHFFSELTWQGSHYLAMSRPLAGIDATALAVIKEDSQTLTPERLELMSLIMIVLLASVFGYLIISSFELLFLRPVTELTRSIKQVDQGDYSYRPMTLQNDELRMLTASYAQMLDRLKEKAEMKNYLSHTLLNQASKNQQVRAEKIQSTVMFAGIRNFSKLEKILEPEQAMELMNLFLSCCEKHIRQSGGEVDKYMGDCVMAYYCQQSEADLTAIDTALAIRQNLQQAIRGLPESMQFNFGIGIAEGELIAGHIGSLKKRLDYTLIGDPVNLAARLEKLAGREGRPAILTTDKLLRGHTDYDYAPVNIKSIKGKNKIVNVMGIKGRRLNS